VQGTFQPGAASADAQIQAAFKGGQGFQGGGAIGQVQQGNTDPLKIAEVVSGSGTQHQGQTGWQGMVRDGVHLTQGLLGSGQQQAQQPVQGGTRQPVQRQAARANPVAGAAAATLGALGMGPQPITFAQPTGPAGSLQGMPGYQQAHAGLQALAGNVPISAHPAAVQAGQATGSPATGAPIPNQVTAMTKFADAMVAQSPAYLYGGGHGSFGAPGQGVDCSGFVSAVLHAGGYLAQPVDTTSLPSQPGIDPGPGQHVTIFDRTGAGQSGHVIIKIEKQFYESGGNANPNANGAVAKINPDPAYLSSFDAILHPHGL
jgi:hypothetical protein